MVPSFKIGVDLGPVYERLKLSNQLSEITHSRSKTLILVYAEVAVALGSLTMTSHINVRILVKLDRISMEAH